MEDLLYQKDSSDAKFLYVRHGETNFNLISSKSKEAKYNINLLNSPLNNKGIEQAKNGAAKLTQFKFEAVFCSPLARTLETTFYLLENHPDVDNIIVKVHPLLTETINGAQDYLSDIQTYKQRFNMNSKVKYDWSIFDSIFPKKIDQDCFVLKYLDDIDEDKKNEMKRIAYENYGNKEIFKDKIMDFVRYSYDIGHRLESYKSIFKRNIGFKRFLFEKFANSINDSQKKVLVVTHSTFIKISTSKLMYNYFKKDERVNSIEDGLWIENCGLLSIHIEKELTKLKENKDLITALNDKELIKLIEEGEK